MFNTFFQGVGAKNYLGRRFSYAPVCI